MVVEHEARDETVAFYLKYSRISFGTKRLLNIQRMFQGWVQKKPAGALFRRVLNSCSFQLWKA